MERTLILSKRLKDKLENPDQSTLSKWNSLGCNNYKDLLILLKESLNNNFSKINISDILFEDDINYLGEGSMYFGFLVESEKKSIDALTFVIPPNYKSRSAVLTQQVFPVLSGIISKTINSNDYHINNKPIYVINLNEENLTAAGAINIICSDILKFNYLDIYNRNHYELLLDNGYSPFLSKVEDLNDLLVENNKQNNNEIFEIYTDVNSRKTIKFLKTRLKDGINVNNEPYWFVLKAYAASYLAIADEYYFNMSEIDTLPRGNKTLNAFRDYISKLSN